MRDVVKGLSPKGEGLVNLSSHKRSTVAVPFALPGETILFDGAENTQPRQNMKRGRLEAVLKPSKARIEPFCELFGQCGGCLLQHMNTKTQEAYKTSLIEKMLQANGFAPKLTGDFSFFSAKRRRLRLQGIVKNGQVYLGMYGYRSNTIIDLKNGCPASESLFKNVIAGLKSLLQKQFKDHDGKVVFTCSLLKGNEGVGVVCQSPIDMPNTGFKSDTESALAAYNVVSFRWNSFVLKNLPLTVMLADKKVAVEADCFLQAHEEGQLSLVRHVLRFFKKMNDYQSPVLDLFAGRGTFTIPLSKETSVIAIENDAKALKALSDVAERENLPITTGLNNLYTLEKVPQEWKSCTFCVLNPPRSGLQNFVKILSEIKLKALCYVSCNPETFFKDAVALRKQGYGLQELILLDQFAWTPHLELVGFFKRGAEKHLHP